VLDTLFHALVRYAAPVLVFTSEEVWQTRFPDADSVHFSDWPEVPVVNWSETLSIKWSDVRHFRQAVNESIEPLRREKVVGSSLQASVQVELRNNDVRFDLSDVDMAEVAIVSQFAWALPEDFDGDVHVTKTTNHKCGRCWRHLPEVVDDGALCGRCADVVGG